MKINLKSKKSIITIVLTLLSLIVIIPLSIFIAFIVNISTSMNSNLSDIEKEAAHKEASLSQISIISDQKTIATGQKNGDSTTGNIALVTATASFNVSGTLAERSNEVGQNLAKSGFKPDKKLQEDTSSLSEIVGITQKYIKDNVVIEARYILAKPYTCPADKMCGYRGESYPQPERIFDVNSLSNEQIKTLEIIYK